MIPAPGSLRDFSFASNTLWWQSCKSHGNSSLILKYIHVSTDGLAHQSVHDKHQDQKVSQGILRDWIPVQGRSSTTTCQCYIINKFTHPNRNRRIDMMKTMQKASPNVETKRAMTRKAQQAACDDSITILLVSSGSKE